MQLVKFNIDKAKMWPFVFVKHIDQVLKIEMLSFERPWISEEFRYFSEQKNTNTEVVIFNSEVVGYILWENLSRTSTLRIVNFAVDPRYRCQGIGKLLLKKLTDKIARELHREILLEVRETNVEAQNYFFKRGFRAISNLRGHFLDTKESAILFRYYMIPEEQVPFVPENRIRHLLSSR